MPQKSYRMPSIACILYCSVIGCHIIWNSLNVTWWHILTPFTSSLFTVSAQCTGNTSYTQCSINDWLLSSFDTPIRKTLYCWSREPGCMKRCEKGKDPIQTCQSYWAVGLCYSPCSHIISLGFHTFSRKESRQMKLPLLYKTQAKGGEVTHPHQKAEWWVSELSPPSHLFYHALSYGDLLFHVSSVR